ncbi:ABC transporter [Streptomyces sp. NPDC092296]|uniref:ABC transporter n=1 Tax=Streptomyces sp. NPDC092296 TaxID=3366012 RepID=UPI0037F6F296
MRALLRYELEFLVRSRRWLPPFLVYALVMGIGVESGQPVLDSLGFGAALLVPVTAWYARCCLTAEPAAARACVAAVVGPRRVQLAQLLAALVAGVVLAVLGIAGVWLLGGPPASGGRPVGAGPVLVAGVLGSLAAVLTGLGAGALCNRPVLRSPAYGIPLSLGLSVALLVATGSPANAAIRALVAGASTGRLGQPVLPLLGAAVFAAAAVWVAVALAGRGSEAPA